MAKQTINIGTTANDGTGDAIRAAFGKVNDNFTEIYTANTGVNTGDQNLSAYATTAAVAAGYQPLDSDLTAISALTTTAYGRALLSTADAATLRSAIGVGTTDAPTFLAQTLTGQSLTGTQATSLVDLSATWNTTGTPSAIKLNVTDSTASSAEPKLIDLQIANVSQFAVKKNVTVGGGYAAAGFWGVQTPWVSFGNYYGSGAICGNNNGLTLFVSPVNGSSFSIQANLFTISNTGGNALAFGQAVILARDADGILAQRNGSSPQAFRVANQVGALPLTDYDRAVFDFKTTLNTLRIGTENSGTTGYTTARPIEFVTGGVVRMSIAAAGNVSIAGVFNFGSSNGVLPGGTIYGGHLGTSQYFAIRGTSASATAIYIQNGSSGDKQGWVRVLGSGSVDHGALEVGALDSSPVIFTTALTEWMRLSAGGNLGIGTATPASKLTVTSGDIEVDTVTSGIILKAAGTSTRYRLTLNAGGTALVFTAV